MESNRLKGVFFIIMSAAGFALMSAFVKLSGDLPSFQKVFFRNLIASIIALYLIIKNGGSMVGKKENRKVLLMRSIFGTLGVIFNFYAIDKLVLSDANMLNKISPFLVVVFSALFLKERIKSKQIIMIIVAFAGSMFIVKPTFSVEVIPYIIGILGAVAAAAAYTCVRAIGNKEDYYTVVFFFSAFSMISILPVVIKVYEPMTIQQFIYLILAGVSASVGQFGITLAYRYAPAREISIFDYTNILFSAVLSIVIFGTYPDKWSIVGYIIVFSAALYMFIYNKNKEKNEKRKSAKEIKTKSVLES